MLERNLIKIYEQSFRNNREMSALTDYFKGETFSYYEVAKEVAKLHLMFKEAGIEKGDKIALIGRNNTRWCISYIATITYGAVIVPILQDFNPNDVINIVNHSESKLLFMGDNFWDDIEGDQIPNIDAVFSLTDFHVIYERDSEKLTSYMKNILSHYREAYPRGFSIDDIKYDEIPNEAICLLNYTSGTTGSSKGVMLSVNNLTGNICFAMDMVNPENGEHYFRKGGRTLSFLPLAHAFGCSFDFLAPLACGAHITLLGRIPSPKILIEAMKTTRPNIVCSVPMILEKVYRKSILPMLEKGPMSIAMRIPLINTAIYSTIRSKLMEQFGGCVEIFVVGGAALNKETEDFLRTIKFPITVGYGMTECAPLISFQVPTLFKSGSCGAILPPELFEAKIMSRDPENIPGELLVRGEHVMMGYYKNEEATKAVLDEDGWLHTGDMCTMDADGTLYIRGRCKTMILSSSGQNIYPEEIEERLNNLYLVGESLIIENNGKLTALVVPDYDLANAEGINLDNLQDIMNKNLEQLNTMVASYEKVANIVIHREEFLKTPKRSIKRYLYSAERLNLNN
ncbi:MAG: AMP-binding protein [Alistipes sp.]|nr:AMP-binding protein [Alistipes sp.]